MTDLTSLTSLCAAAALLCAVPVLAAREYGGYYTAERIANLRANCEKYAWAKKQKERAIARAKRWAEMDDEQLWRMIPGQDLPRCIDVTWDYTKTPHRVGCLQCGNKIFAHGNYPYRPDIFGKPWKLTCPSCGAVFPTNDFGKYYESAIDERGLFNPAKGDRSLLFNAEHPDPNDPMHMFGVDDGFGYIDENGRAHKFIGYYVWKYWRELYAGVGALADAYLYTGDRMYARKAAVMLDRIADVYPDMDWSPYAARGWFHSDGGSKKGKIEGRIWECGVLRNFARNYDKIISGTVDNPELYAFLKRISERYDLPGPKGTRDDLIANIDRGILQTGAEAVIAAQIQGNQGMHQSAIAQCAIALDTEPLTSEWLDWVFAPDGGRIPGTIVGAIDRDGVGAEAAPGYALSWGSNIGALADMLADYPDYAKHDIYRDFPQFKQTFTAGWRIAVLGFATPNIGDSGACGTTGKVSCAPSFIARGYRYLRDPDIALAAYRANGDSAEGLGRSVLDADPDRIPREIGDIAKQKGVASRPGGHNMAGYGLASIEFGRGREGKAVWCYYGRNGGHGHPDRLNIGIYAFGLCMVPDLGYPEFATRWPKRMEWTDNTICHNTVVVDETRQKVTWVGQPRFFKQLPGIGAFEVSSPNVYPQTNEYARTLISVETPDGNAYTVDVFRVEGGKDHLLSFHGVPGEVTTTGLNLVPQKQGTYAGPDLPFAAHISGPRMGYSYLYDVERDAQPGGQFTIDWKAEEGYRGVKADDDIHLRWRVFTQCDDIALASGDPPQNKRGNPRRLRYALLHRAGDELASEYVSLIEPYRDAPFVQSAERIPIGSAASLAVALRIKLTDGSVDYVLYSPSGERVEVPDGPSLRGRVGFLRIRGGVVQRAALIYGSELSWGGFILKAETPAYKGTVVRMDRDMEADGRIWVDAALPTDGSLLGQQIIIENDGARNACYDIRKVERDGDLTMISCGDVSFIRGYKDPKDYDAGFAYNFKAGATFSIPNHAYVEREKP